MDKVVGHAVTRRFVPPCVAPVSYGALVTSSTTAAEPAYLSSSEARALLFVSRSQLSRYCLDGRLDAVKTPGGSWRIKRDQAAIREALERAR